MQYLALLRGINVGGNKKVSMATLKKTFVRLGFTDVRTYINSGNVIFASERNDVAKMTTEIEAAIEQDFGFAVPVVLRSKESLEMLAAAIPESWQNNDIMKSDIMFLWEAADTSQVLQHCVIKPEIDEVFYQPGAVLWRVDRKHQPQSGMLDLVGTKLYKQMTIRNVNTVRKLLELMR